MLKKNCICLQLSPFIIPAWFWLAVVLLLDIHITIQHHGNECQCVQATQLSQLLGNYWQELYIGELVAQSTKWKPYQLHWFRRKETGLKAKITCFGLWRETEKEGVPVFKNWAKLAVVLWQNVSWSHEKAADYWWEEAADVPNKLSLQNILVMR